MHVCCTVGTWQKPVRGCCDRIKFCLVFSKWVVKEVISRINQSSSEWFLQRLKAWAGPSLMGKQDTGIGLTVCHICLRILRVKGILKMMGGMRHQPSWDVLCVCLCLSVCLSTKICQLLEKACLSFLKGSVCIEGAFAFCLRKMFCSLAVYCFLEGCGRMFHNHHGTD